MPTERITFPGHAGTALAARLDLPEGPVLATALFAHCFTCSKDIPAARRIAGRLASMGIAVLRFDFTGLGHSDGEFENTSFSSNVSDLIAAAQYLAGRDMAPQLLIGHSLGGAAVLRARAGIPSVRGVVTLGAPYDPEHVAHNFGSQLTEIEAVGAAEVCLGGRPFTIRRQFLDDIRASALGPCIAGLDAALLVMHAPRDETVGIDNAAEIFAAAKHPKSFVTLDDADHLISRAQDAEYAAEVIAAWAGRYVEMTPPAPPPGAPEGIVRVAEADPEGFLQDIQSGPHHHALADEPLAYGGTNRGMSPYGFVAAGLGACTSMTIRMYARRKEWPLDSVSVDVCHDKVHAQDAAPAGPAKIDQFTRKISLCGTLTPDQRASLLEIADKCPVHRTLESGARVITVDISPH
ncbi:MAG: bifunctional alpha/beta hydrolase/OsmC family protein [Pseudophaeobacter sp. bin_em_oilr2.035]|uniref:Bifunctional alpha/beta hydrolase/OsmC family protein n=1 Tax=Phaeobacter gallaeciensis TaxID=60890 RepID=A0ABD4X5V9_9RHOB|nr:bifunctional alpha/beta hydrolase/OsmC family protein [Phaeobacter gallaeciensis]MDF1771259.1 bifunctional alpha/beta hydrolase/OsmC family protein [Pseudophaeobacter sp. bin_em_oilr2.035]MDE4143811.1 bifunctional alpha/beta hydrolase/OsmC family protein [Phaeobacter gallaeciensis]MDE4155827.1 bifunctional alpha/beta hydrolase/OsmC family protein [Phaeobacter gallaeciensis]MDE4160015.1 bifunctional alpha/beta hydrolase/OsmC family protein [Phaeobacter gallaeciensis]MDE4164891.1 bifunctional